MKQGERLRNSAKSDGNLLLPVIEILGDRRILVERHKGVCGYDKERVCVRLSFGMLRVDGCNLEIVHMTKTQLVINGNIQNVRLNRGRD